MTGAEKETHFQEKVALVPSLLDVTMLAVEYLRAATFPPLVRYAAPGERSGGHWVSIRWGWV